MKKLLLRWTYWIWHTPLSRCLNFAYEENIITGEQWHSLAAMFDRTQKEHYQMEACQHRQELENRIVELQLVIDRLVNMVKNPKSPATVQHQRDLDYAKQHASTGE